MKSGLGGEAYASCEMLDRTFALREFYEQFRDRAPGAGGLEDRESLLTHLKKKISTEKFLARRFFAIQQALGMHGAGQKKLAPRIRKSGRWIDEN